MLDHYRDGAEALTPTQQTLRAWLLRTPPYVSLPFIRAVVAVLWPAHRFFWKYRQHPQLGPLRQKLLYYSPVLDAYAQLGPKLLYAWASLDTHDALTDVYKHQRTVDDIVQCLQACGMCDVEAAYGGNGVEARARQPLKPMAEHP